MTYCDWQEHIHAGERYDEIRILTVFPIDKGFLITMRGHMRDGKASFGHAETTFFASFQQAQEITDVLLKHIGDKNHQSNTSGPDPQIP